MFAKLWAKLKSKKIVVCIIIFLFILLSIGSSLIQFFLDPAQSPYLETLYYSTQIVSSLFVTGGVIIAVWQYYLSSQSAKINLEVVQVQRAVDLAEYYKDNILRYIQPISYTYAYTGVSEILNKIKPESLNHFDEAEMESLMSPEDIKALDIITNSNKFATVFIKANDIYNLGLNPSRITVTDKNGEETQKQAYDSAAVFAFIGNMFSDVLNNMEFFAMHFSHNTADESVVYESLHQTYLDIVHLLYFKIARQNKASAVKYYTNVVWLYKEWITRKQQKDQDFLNGVRNLTENGTVIKK